MTPDLERQRAGEPAPRLERILKIVVAGLAILIIAGLAAVVWRMVELASSPKATAGKPGAAISAVAPAQTLLAEAELSLPPGAVVRSIALDGNRLAVHYEAPNGSGIALIELDTGRTLARVRLTPMR